MSLQELDNDPFAAANLYGRTLNVCADLPDEPIKGRSIFKRITGGDRLSAQHKYKDRFAFTPAAHLVFSSNHAIQAPEGDEAFWSRWIVVPFENQFEHGSDDYEDGDHITERLQDPEELSALLNAALNVLPDVLERGIHETESMRCALDTMRAAREAHRPERSAVEGDGHMPDTAPDAPKPHRASVREKQEDVRGRETRSDGALEAEKTFRKAEDSDTGGACPKRGAHKKFSDADVETLCELATGDRVRTPDGTGTVQEIAYGTGTVAVLLDDDIGARTYPPDVLSDATDAPF